MSTHGTRRTAGQDDADAAAMDLLTNENTALRRVAAEPPEALEADVVHIHELGDLINHLRARLMR